MPINQIDPSRKELRKEGTCAVQLEEKGHEAGRNGWNHAG